MSLEFEFIRPEDKPALLALTTPDYLSIAQTVLNELEYKIHTPLTHEDFIMRFAQIQYQLVVLEECFQCSSPEENISLRTLQTMPMNLRRHATVLLIGSDFQTMNPMQGFQQSVHAVIHPTDLLNLSGVVQKAIADNSIFLSTYYDTLRQLNAPK